MKLQRIEQAVLNLREVLTDDARSLRMIQPPTQTEQTEGRPCEIANRYHSDRGDKSVKQHGAGVSPELSERLERQNRQPSHGKSGQQQQQAAQHLVAVVLADKGVQILAQVLMWCVCHGEISSTENQPLKLRRECPIKFMNC